MAAKKKPVKAVQDGAPAKITGQPGEAAKSETMKSIVVSVDQNHELNEVTDQLEKSGFKISQSLDAISVVTGSAPEHALDKMKAIAGVASIEEERDDYRTTK